MVLSGSVLTLGMRAVRRRKPEGWAQAKGFGKPFCLHFAIFLGFSNDYTAHGMAFPLLGSALFFFLFYFNSIFFFYFQISVAIHPRLLYSPRG